MKEAWTLEAILAINLKFPTFTLNKPKGWSISASNTEANSAAFIMRGITLILQYVREITKILLIKQEGSLKIYKTLKFPEPLLQVKNDTSLNVLFISVNEHCAKYSGNQLKF